MRGGLQSGIWCAAAEPRGQVTRAGPTVASHPERRCAGRGEGARGAPGRPHPRGEEPRRRTEHG